MSPIAVVEHLDVVKHIIPRLLAGGIVTERRALTRETAKEPLGHGLVQAIALATHTTAHAGRRQQGLIGSTRLLTPALRRMEHPGGGLATPQRHL
jgi:hypothetical protein